MTDQSSLLSPADQRTATAQNEDDRQRADIEALKGRLARADDALMWMVVQYMEFPDGYVGHECMSAQEDAIEYLEDIGWLTGGALERYYWTEASGRGGAQTARVSSTEAQPEAALQEETRASGMGTCPRCGKPLDNISPGISVIAGGVSVCTTCAGPGEEMLRARGI